MRKIYAFDFDGTLTKRDSLLEFIRFARGNWAFLVGFLKYLPLLILMKIHLYPNYKAKQKIFAHFFGGMPIEEFDGLCQRFAQEKKGILNKWMVGNLNKALADGDEVVIVSASIDNWVQPFFPEVKVLGTKIEVVDGMLTGNFLSKNCYGREKVKRLMAEYPERENYYLVAYGDSRGDKEMLAFADEGTRIGHSHFSVFKVKREEWLPSLFILAVFLFLNGLCIHKYFDKFTAINRGFWSIFVDNFSISGFDPITYNVVSRWDTNYNVYRHPLLSFEVYPLYVVNKWMMETFGINLVQFVVGFFLIFAVYYSFIFAYRIMREVIRLKRIDATIMSLMLFSFAYVMLAYMVPDHFAISMFLLLWTVFVCGKRLRDNRKIGIFQTVFFFLLTAGVTLSNGIKIFIYTLFVNGKRFFRPKYLAFAVFIPAIALWIFTRWEYSYFVYPKAYERNQEKLAKDREKKHKEFLVFKDTTSIKDSAEIVRAFRRRVQAEAHAIYVYNHTHMPWHLHQGANMLDREHKKAMENGNFIERYIYKQFGEFNQWTDVTTSRWDTAVENLFGESIQLHEDYLLDDTLKHRPVIVKYRYFFNYLEEGLIVGLFLIGIWFGRRSRFLWMCLGGMSFDVFLHFVLGFGINEVYIMGAHWLFVVPIAIAYLFKRMENLFAVNGLRILVILISLNLYIWNIWLICRYLG